MNVLTKRFWMYYHIIVLHEIKQKKIFFKVSTGADYADLFFLKWDIPLVTIQYFKRKNNI